MMQSKFTPLLDTGVVYSCDVARRSRGAMSDGHERGKRQEKKEGRVAKEMSLTRHYPAVKGGSFPKSTSPWRYPEDK